mgnify:CR=1 FL=1
MFFFPQDELARNRAKKMFEIIVEKEGLEFLGWREVPTFPNVLGKKAVDCMPYIMQGFVKKPKDVNKGIEFDRKLYVARRVFEQTAEDTYVCSLSSRTIVYKGMFLVGQLRTFFKDLTDESYESAIALVHSRFSTNTNPSWNVPIQTDLSFTTVRLIQSREMPTECFQEKKQWFLHILRMRCLRSHQLLTPMVRIQLCLITHLNSLL